ncbi:exocyst complex component EXO70C1-like [Bidens hawaiensis]|uniref:exocyst complex component EXO70C1-like n=1 Tax=Bidens hawaiensis TaxID=980011 RepID=UPI00404A2952
MERHNAKSGSFIGRHRWRSNLESPRSSFSNRAPNKSSVLPEPHLSESSDDQNDPIKPLPNVDHDQIFAELDAFTEQVSKTDEKTTPPDLPDVMETFSLIIKSKTRKPSPHEDMFLFDSVQRLSKLKTALAEFSDTSSHDKVGKLVHRVMAFMGEELRVLLVDSNASSEPKLKVISSKHFSFKTERCPLPEPSKEQDYPGFTEENINKMNKLVNTMISSGYKNECSNVYSIARGNALYEQLRRLDFEKLNAEEVQKLNWDWLEADISRWIRIIKHFSHFLIPAERKLGEAVFAHHLSVFRGVSVSLIRSLVTSLLDYAATVAMMKRSAERLFKFLDMYESLQGLKEAMKDSSASETKDEQPYNDLNVEYHQ